MNLDASERVDYHVLNRSLGLTIDPDLLALALTHRSYAHENGALPTNERLEFFGDSVLGIVVTEFLYPWSRRGPLPSWPGSTPSGSS